MEYAEFNVQMSRLVSCFSKGNISDELKSAYWESVKRWDAESFAYVVTRSAQDDERFPKIPKLREYLTEIKRKTDSFSVEPQPTFICKRCNDSFGVPLAWLLNNWDVACPCYAENTNARKCNTRYNLQFLQTAWSNRGSNLCVIL